MLPRCFIPQRIPTDQQWSVKRINCCLGHRRRTVGFAPTDGTPKLQDLNAGYGIGARMAFLFALLKFDVAWKTDLTKSGSPGDPIYYLSLGSEF